MEVAPQLVEPFSNGARSDSYRVVTGIRGYVANRRCAPVEKHFLGERNAEWTVLLHVKSQMLSRDIAETQHRARDSLIRREALLAVAEHNEARPQAGLQPACS